MSAPSQLQPVWLVSDGRVLGAAMRATTRSDRRRGLIGVDDLSKPLVIEPCKWIHTIGMHAPLDVVYVDANNTVIDMASIKPWRVGAYVREAKRVIEAEHGFIDRWKIQPGITIEVRDVEQ
jgi:uncharacterized membrane protein (UPF0127 family)